MRIFESVKERRGSSRAHLIALYRAFSRILQVAGKIGLLAKTKWGYGKFRVISVDIRYQANRELEKEK